MSIAKYKLVLLKVNMYHDPPMTMYLKYSTVVKHGVGRHRFIETAKLGTLRHCCACPPAMLTLAVMNFYGVYTIHPGRVRVIAYLRMGRGGRPRL